MAKITLTPLKKGPPDNKEFSGKSDPIRISKIEIKDSGVIRLPDFLLESARNKDCKLYGIIDSAKNEDVFRLMITGNVEYKSLFEGKMDVQSYGVSGFLVECQKDSILFEWMINEAWGGNCCIFFASKSSFSELFEHFQKFNRVFLEGNEVMLFRYYDPRVLKLFLPTCDKDQIESFFGNVDLFFAEDENSSYINVFKKSYEEILKPLNIMKYEIQKEDKPDI